MDGECEAKDTFKIISWNINGIRSLKTPLQNYLSSFDADIVCFQETKATRDQIEETIAFIDGYSSYFSFSRKRSGYSGVATYCKNTIRPVAAEEGLTGLLDSAQSDIDTKIGCWDAKIDQVLEPEMLYSLDKEGRALLTKHRMRLKDGSERDFVVINVYCPRADPNNPERKDFKLDFYRILQRRAEAILKAGCHVIIAGDVNTSHKPIDHCDPDEIENFSANPGRKWLNQFLLDQSDSEPSGGSAKFVDSFRYLNPQQTNAFTCWSTVTGARHTNYGTRIDYIFVDKDLCTISLLDGAVLSDVEGSDHCPVMATFRGTPIASAKLPRFSTKFWPEFSGKQVKLSQFVQCGERTVKTGSASPEEVSETSKRKRTEQQFCGPMPKRLTNTVGIKQRSITSFLKSNARKETQQTTNSSSKLTSLFASKRLETSSQQAESATEIDLSEKAPQIVANSTSSVLWKSLLTGPKPAPLCKGHKEPCILRTVKKPGMNMNRQFYVCARPEGHSSNSEARCNYFQWVNASK